MDIGLNWNEWHQEAARKPYVRVGVTLLSGALILMSAQEIVSLSDPRGYNESQHYDKVGKWFYKWLKKN